MIEYWFELRQRLLQCVCAYGVCFVALVMCYDRVYKWITYPLHLNQFGSLISHSITEPLTFPFQLAGSLSWFLIAPMVLYHLASFIRPALYHQEKRLMCSMMVASVCLFYLGVALGFFFVQPMLLGLLQEWIPSNTMFLPSISSYLMFSLDIAFAFGLLFQVPIILMALIIQGWVPVEWVHETRRYWVVGIFVFAMVMTPPDVYSQMMLAMPLWLLIEVVLLVSRLFLKVSSKETLALVD